MINKILQIVCRENQYAGFLKTGYPFTYSDADSSSEISSDSEDDRIIDDILKGIAPKNMS